MRKAGQIAEKLLFQLGSFAGYYLFILPVLAIQSLISSLIWFLSLGLTKDGIYVTGFINFILFGVMVSRAFSQIMSVWLAYILGFVISAGVFLLVGSAIENGIESYSSFVQVISFLFVLIFFPLPTVLILLMLALGFVLGLISSPACAFLDLLLSILSKLVKRNKELENSSSKLQVFYTIKSLWEGKLKLYRDLENSEFQKHGLINAITSILRSMKNFKGGDFIWELDGIGKVAVLDIPLNVVKVVRWVFYVVFAPAFFVLVLVMYLVFLVAVFVFNIGVRVGKWIFKVVGWIFFVLFKMVFEIVWVLFNVGDVVVSPLIPVRVKVSDYEKGDSRKRILEFISDVLNFIVLSYGEGKLTRSKSQKIVILRDKIGNFVYDLQNDKDLSYKSSEIFSLILPELKVKTSFSIFDGGMKRGVFLNSKGLIRKMRRNIGLLKRLVDVKMPQKIAELITDKIFAECVKDGIKMTDSSFEFIRTLGWIIVVSITEIFLLGGEKNYGKVKSGRVKLMKRISDAVAYKLTNSAVLETAFAD